MKLRSLFIILLLSSLCLAQTTRSSRSRGRARAQAADAKLLNRETATKLLRPVVESKQPPEPEVLDLSPTTVPPEQLRTKFSSYRIADRCGWITMHVEDGKTIIELTAVGRRLFESGT